MKLTEITVKKGQGYIPNGLDNLIKDIKNKSNEGNQVRMNFEVSENLRNNFKAKVAKEGNKVKDVLAAFMTEYIKH